VKSPLEFPCEFGAGACLLGRRRAGPARGRAAGRRWAAWEAGARRTAAGHAMTKTKAKPAKRSKVAFSGCKIDSKPSYLIARGLLNAKQLKQADKFFKSRAVQTRLEASLLYSSDKPQTKQRNSRDATFHPKDEPMLFRRLSGITKAADQKFKTLRYSESSGKVLPKYDDMQYAEYVGGSHFAEWHLDGHEGDDGPEDTRKLTAVLMLSDSSSYTGGKFQIKRGRLGNKGASEVPPPKQLIEDVKLEAGDCVLFPAKKVWHRVTKTHSGLRRTVVFWTG
jgi:hypothetical protein